MLHKGFHVRYERARYSKTTFFSQPEKQGAETNEII